MNWFEGTGSVRLEHDLAILAEDQPGLCYVVQPGGPIHLAGDLSFKLRSGIPVRIPTRIEFPADYPAREPIAFEMSSRFPHDADHHFFRDGRCCLWLDVESRWRAEDPDAIRLFLDQLKVFYLRQLMMEADPSLPFPGPSRGHGTLGYMEHLEERLEMPRNELPRMVRALDGGVSRNAPCPCGRRTRYRNCHRDAIRRFRELAAPECREVLIKHLDATRSGGASRDPQQEALTESNPSRRSSSTE